MKPLFFANFALTCCAVWLIFININNGNCILSAGWGVITGLGFGCTVNSYFNKQ